jgi:hypothetical protein
MEWREGGIRIVRQDFVFSKYGVLAFQEKFLRVAIWRAEMEAKTRREVFARESVALSLTVLQP